MRRGVIGDRRRLLSSVIHDRSATVSSLPSLSPARIAVTGCQKLKLYFALIPAMKPSAIAMLTRASSRARCHESSACASATTRAMWLHPNGEPSWTRTARSMFARGCELRCSVPRSPSPRCSRGRIVAPRVVAAPWVQTVRHDAARRDRPVPTRAGRPPTDQRGRRRIKRDRIRCRLPVAWACAGRVPDDVCGVIGLLSARIAAAAAAPTATPWVLDTLLGIAAIASEDLAFSSATAAAWPASVPNRVTSLRSQSRRPARHGRQSQRPHRPTSRLARARGTHSADTGVRSHSGRHERRSARWPVSSMRGSTDRP